MKNIFKLLLATILCASGASICTADSLTTTIGLIKPSIGSTGWGTKNNGNWDIVDSSVAVLAGTNTYTGANIFQGGVTVSTLTVSSVTLRTAYLTYLTASSGTITNANITGLIGSTVTYSSATFTRMNVSTATLPNIVGTTAADNAAVGNWGQYITSSSVITTLASSQVLQDLVSFSVTAGDWEFDFSVQLSTNGATVGGNSSCGIGTVAGNSVTGLAYYANAVDQRCPLSGPSGVSNCMATIPRWRAQPTSTTTYYLKCYMSFSAGNPTAQGTLSARRPR